MSQTDHFSQQAVAYAKFRPTYPQALFSFLLDRVNQTERAWDCGTGNGQVATVLAKTFTQVKATDISQRQLDQAQEAANIHYQQIGATHTNFAAQSFDLVTVAQALHWFDFLPFFKEVKRVLKPHGYFATWCYSLLKIDEEIDPIIEYFYTQIVGSYWPEERKHIDQHYQTIPFDFPQLEKAEFESSFEWNLAHLLGYLSSWSSTQACLKQTDENPLIKIEADLRSVWGDRTRIVTFPIHFFGAKM